MESWVKMGFHHGNAVIPCNSQYLFQTFTKTEIYLKHLLKQFALS